MTQFQECTAVTTVPVTIYAPNSLSCADAITLPVGTGGVFIKREWRTGVPGSLNPAFVNHVRVETLFGTRWLQLLDHELEISNE